jgi:hypothetical protein
MIEEKLLKRGIRLTPKGRRWSESLEVIVFYLGIIAVFAFAGTVESGRWF